MALGSGLGSVSCLRDGVLKVLVARWVAEAVWRPHGVELGLAEHAEPALHPAAAPWVAQNTAQLVNQPLQHLGRVRVRVRVRVKGQGLGVRG